MYRNEEKKKRISEEVHVNNYVEESDSKMYFALLIIIEDKINTWIESTGRESRNAIHFSFFAIQNWLTIANSGCTKLYFYINMRCV